MSEVDQPSLLSAGIATYLLVNASDLEPPGQVGHLELVGLHGDSLADLAIATERSPHADTLYNASAFIPPPEFFYIKVIVMIIIIITNVNSIIFINNLILLTFVKRTCFTSSRVRAALNDRSLGASL